LDPEVQDEFVELLTKNARFAGVGRDLKQSPPSPTSDGAPAETIARPENSNAPVCFVIMPFVERDEDRYPTGFFAEVLASIFSPAITGAGLQVRTAQRQGSDLIQATIVRELFEADLVLADLTEHNPNVLFELGLRIAENKPVVLVRSKGTGRIFDVDHVLRIEEYSPNLWPSTVAQDLPKLEAHIKAAWDNRDSVETYRNILTRQLG
jgi:nucleoside 2-deoxyribosyltransferase